MRLSTFLLEHAVFTLEELDAYLASKGSINRNTRNNLLTYYQKKGYIKRVRRGLYLVHSRSGALEKSSVDPYIIAAKMTKDAVLAYHTALEFHGKAYSVFNRYHYLSQVRSSPLHFQSYLFQGLSFPKVLCDKRKEMFGVISHYRSGVEIRVTSFERTLVDVLDRPLLSGSWEEIWRSVESIEFFDLDFVLEYVKLLNIATTAAKVGFFLEQHSKSLMVNDTYLNRLKKLCPKEPHYLMGNRKAKGHLMKEWNIIVPHEIIHKTWEEVS